MIKFLFNKFSELQAQISEVAGGTCDKDAREAIQELWSKFASLESGNKMSKEDLEELQVDVNDILQIFLEKKLLEASDDDEEDGSGSVASIVSSVRSISSACSKHLEEPTCTPSKNRDDDTKPPAQPTTSASQELVSPLGIPSQTTPVASTFANPFDSPSANPFASPGPNNLPALAKEPMSPLDPLHPPSANPFDSPLVSPRPSNQLASAPASASEETSPLGFPRTTPVPVLTPAVNPSQMSSLSVASTFASPTLSSVCTAETTPGSGGISVLSDITNQTN
eukprot:CAMPEP_0182517562 /NCGR_PEP_ID=MMETSP1321-20130603/42469_1 /TAXON_ID=91990 /ORGANISM="Bolidomonas sp., Strain RCC1657" /LENGTH=280 /DNA_ID=CAMNT_0024725317 /DNA_START=9 /DNA_END=851 /DNA_ORIENTATION=+